MSERIIESIRNVCWNVFCVGWHQCCQLVYIYIPNLKSLVYFQRAWYINILFGIYEKFGVGMCSVLVGTSVANWYTYIYPI